MPGDVTGSLVYDARRAEFSLPRGPGLHQPAARRRDQPHAAEDPGRAAGGDGGAQVSRRRHRRARCPTPFLVAATQNPVEYEGTYPLPEAQLDRFLLKLMLPLPERDDELEILRRHAAGFDPRDLAGAGVAPGRRRRRPRRGPRPPYAGCRSRPRSLGYVVDIARATRQSPVAEPRASPRAARPRCCRPPGVGLAVRPRLRHPRRRQGARPRRPCAHRLQLRPEAELEGVDADAACSTACSPPSRCPR